MTPGEFTRYGVYFCTFIRRQPDSEETRSVFELAACAKRNGLDAIHDTVHEMARDEARHGKALEGLLNRYFK